MSSVRHGVSVGIARIGNEFFLSIKAFGKLKHEDYLTINPMIDSALEGVKNPYINALIDASEFQGWELRAAWDDLKLDLKHSHKFSKIAIFGNKKWQKYAAKIGTWFVSGEIKYFEDSELAIAWLQE